MEFVLIAILIAAVFAFLAYPLFTPTREENSPSSNALETLIAQRDSAYAAIRDLDFDFQLGKLSESDYRTLRERYKARAASVLQQIDAVSGDVAASADARIEEEVTRRRAAKTPDEEVIEREVARLRAKVTRTRQAP